MINNKKQTAVEWYIDELLKLDVKYLNSRYGNQMTTVEYSDCKEQIKKKAKEMERERIEKDYMSGYSNGGLDTCITPQQYYNETYGGNK